MKILVVDDGFKKNTENDNFLNLMPWLTNGEFGSNSKLLQNCCLAKNSLGVIINLVGM